MFSLIITIISIALVAALALATLYYGGTAFNKGAADAEAARIMLQGQQVLGAAELYFTDNREWPATMQALVDGNYLKDIPSVKGPMGEALAAENTWFMPVASQPIFVLATANNEVCKKVNKRAWNVEGILSTAHTQYAVQCYGGSDAALKTVFSKSGATVGAQSGHADIGTVTAGCAPADVGSPNWHAAPSSAPHGCGGGGGVSLSHSSFTFPEGKLGRYYWLQNEVVLTNNTAASIELLGAYADDPDWFLDMWEGSCYNIPTYPMLPAGQSCGIDVAFDAWQLGSYAAVGTVYTSAGDFSVNLFGTAVDAPPLAQLATSVSYVNIVSGVGETVASSFTLSNVGEVPANITLYWGGAENTNGVSYTHDCPFPLPVGSTCNFTVSVTAPMPQNYNFRLVFLDEDEQWLKALTIMGYTDYPEKPHTFLNPAYPGLDTFGQILLGTGAVGETRTLTGTLTNTSQWPATLRVMPMAFIHLPGLKTNTDRVTTWYTTTCPTTLQPGESCELTLHATPLDPMDYQPYMSLQFNDRPISGYGFDATAQ